MRRYRAIALLCGALLVAGCDAETEEAAIDEDVEDRTPYENTKLAADTSEGFEQGDVPAPVVPTQGEAGPADVTVPGPLTATGNLVGVAENAPPGTVTVTEAGRGTTVLVKIDRYAPGTTLVASLVLGRCNETGRILTRIGEPFTIGPQGFATLTASVPRPTRALLDGRHSIRINTPGRGDPEFVLACANLPLAENVR